MNFATLPVFGALVAALILCIDTIRTLNDGKMAKNRIRTRFIFMAVLIGLALLALVPVAIS